VRDGVGGRRGPAGLKRHAVAEDIVMSITDQVKSVRLHGDMILKT
jgi:hypothetical protein